MAGVEPVTTQQHDVRRPERCGAVLEIQVVLEPRRPVVRGQRVSPGRRVEDCGLVGTDAEPSACTPHAPVGRRGEQRVVAGIALVDHRTVVRELAAVVHRHLRARAHQQRPVAWAVVEVLLDPPGCEPVGPPQAETHHLAGVAVPGLEEVLPGAPSEPALHLDVGDDPARAGEGVVPLAAADEHRLGALRHGHAGIVDAPADAEAGSLPAQALVDGKRAVGGLLARVRLEVRERGVDRGLGDGVLLLQPALGAGPTSSGPRRSSRTRPRGPAAARAHGEPVPVADELDRSARQRRRPPGPPGRRAGPRRCPAAADAPPGPMGRRSAGGRRCRPGQWLRRPRRRVRPSRRTGPSRNESVAGVSPAQLAPTRRAPRPGAGGPREHEAAARGVRRHRARSGTPARRRHR